MASCPICKKKTVQEHRPFCSARCADVDLGRWVTGNYALPSEEPLSDHDIERVIEHAKEKMGGSDQLH